MAGHGFNFLQNAADALGAGEYEGVVSAAFAGGILVLSALSARAALSARKDPLIPDATPNLRNFFELIIGFLLSVGDIALGRENRRYLPFVLTLFFYVLAMNLLGLIPGFSMPTDNIPINLGIALTVFVIYHFWGMREVGFVNYWKHFMGPIAILAPFIFVLELFSHIVRPVTLTLRLFGNMTADHTILGVFTDLTRVIIPVIFYAMGTFVCFIQAFVFTVLTMVYINLAVTHESHEHGAAH